MKIKLTKPAGFLSSAKHILIETNLIETIEDTGEERVIVLSNGQRFEVTESVEQIEALQQTKPEPAKPAEKTETEND